MVKLKVGDKKMVMHISNSGKGVNMVTPNGESNVYCNLTDLVEMLEGKSNFVNFTISKREVSVQRSFEDIGEDGQ